ncbi:hypothetical protein DITRI_Ditri18aG0052800 [Diplodiscus trichospermus]
MEVAVELEDDIFFADLSKQISLLIMDDDEDPVATCPSVSFQVLTIYMLFIHSKHVISCIFWTISISSRANLQKRKQQRHRSFYPKVITAKKEA